jgi:hypothetical protein
MQQLSDLQGSYAGQFCNTEFYFCQRLVRTGEQSDMNSIQRYFRQQLYFHFFNQNID